MNLGKLFSIVTYTLDRFSLTFLSLLRLLVYTQLFVCFFLITCAFYYLDTESSFGGDECKYFIVLWVTQSPQTLIKLLNGLKYFLFGQLSERFSPSLGLICKPFYRSKLILKMRLLNWAAFIVYLNSFIFQQNQIHCQLRPQFGYTFYIYCN